MDAPSALVSFRRISDEAILMPPSQFLVIGDEFLVSGTLPSKVKKPAVVSLSKKVEPSTTITDARGLFEKAHQLGTRSVAGFTLPSKVLKRLKTLAVELGATHVRFFAHEERGIVARLFDARVGSDVLLPRLKRIHAAATITISDHSANDFSFTISIETLIHLPADDLLVSVYRDGIMEAEPVSAKMAHSFYCRDQGVCEPFTSFRHEKLERTVYFVSHPSE